MESGIEGRGKPSHSRPALFAFRFAGRTRVRLTPLRPSADIHFNACDLSIRRAAWHGPAGEVSCPFRFDPVKETLTVFLPECVSDPVEVTFDYEGIINDRMAGLYRSGFRSGEGVRWIAVTQFQESDASMSN